MKIKELFEYINDVKPNAYTDEQKMLWLNELEARVQREVLLMGDCIQYDWPEDGETELLLKSPHDSLYRHWMEAMVDYENGEYNKYQNTMQMFNQAWSAFVCWFAELYRPADGYAARRYFR